MGDKRKLIGKPDSVKHCHWLSTGKSPNTSVPVLSRHGNTPPFIPGLKTWKKLDSFLLLE